MADDPKNYDIEGGLEYSQEELDAKAAKARKAAKKKKNEIEDMKVNITSLMDIMTIMLVFLLVSVTSDPLNIKQDNNLLLAKSTVNYNPGEDSIPITINKQNVLVDTEAAVSVHCQFQGRECTEDDIIQLVSCERYIENCSPQALDILSFIPEDLPADAQAGREMSYNQKAKECAAKGEECSAQEYANLKKMKFYFDKTDKQDGDESKFLVVPLHKMLKQKVKDQKQENMDLGREFKGITTIIADRDIPFRMLAEVVHTAGMAELHDIRFAIVKTTTR